MRATLFVILSLLLVFTASAGTLSESEDRISLRLKLLYGDFVVMETPSTTLSFDALFDEGVRRPQRHDPWFSFDKVQHFTFSALFTVGGQYALVNKFSLREGQALPISMFTSFTIGLTKELYDWQVGPRQYFSWRDMTANGVGILVAAGFILL